MYASHDVTLVAGVSFDTSLTDLISQIPVAMKVFAHGVENFLLAEDDVDELVPSLSCQGNSSNDGEANWAVGERFHE